MRRPLVRIIRLTNLRIGGYRSGVSTFRTVAGPDGSARHRILSAIRSHGPLTRAQLARATGLAPSTVTEVSQTLGSEHVLIETEIVRSEERRTGPKSRALAFEPSLSATVGVDFGFRTVRALVADVAGRPLASGRAELPVDYDADRGLSVARGLIDEVVQRAGVPMPATAGVAIPGPVDTQRQRVVGSSILPGWSESDAGDFEAALGLPVIIENDANLAALGEHTFGAGTGVANTITIKFHSGIGAGIIVHDRLVSGVRGGAGEIGHVEIDPQGPLCRCGKRGCLDTFASVPAILASMRPQHDVESVAELLALLAAGDAGAKRCISDAAVTVGKVVATASLLLAPERIIIVGAMARAGDVVTLAIRDVLEREGIPQARSVPDVVLGELDDRHTAMGAVALGLSAQGWLPESIAPRVPENGSASAG
jgi:predicted NBD/HSP70 family sugar kinase